MEKKYRIRYQYTGQPIGFWSGAYDSNFIEDYKENGLKADLLKCDYIEIYEDGKPDALERINRDGTTIKK